MQDDVLSKVELFVRRRHNFEQVVLKEGRDAKINVIREELAAKGHGFLIDSNDSRFDEPKLEYFKALITARLDAYFEAYDAYGLPVDDHILRQLQSFVTQTVAGTTASLVSEATAKAVRMGRNSAQPRAAAESLGIRIQRFTHSYLQSLFCEVEKKKHLPALPAATPNGSLISTKRKKKKSKLTKRQSVIFAAILLRLKGMKYCTFLHDHQVKLRSSDSFSVDYPFSYKSDARLRKKIQDEKTRANGHLADYTDSELADAFKRFFPDLLSALRKELATRATHS
jgi:hypothetical protein